MTLMMMMVMVIMIMTMIMIIMIITIIIMMLLLWLCKPACSRLCPSGLVCGGRCLLVPHPPSVSLGHEQPPLRPPVMPQHLPYRRHRTVVVAVVVVAVFVVVVVVVNPVPVNPVVVVMVVLFNSGQPRTGASPDRGKLGQKSAEAQAQ
jgi:hypothetical protein